MGLGPIWSFLVRLFVLVFLLSFPCNVFGLCPLDFNLLINNRIDGKKKRLQELKGKACINMSIGLTRKNMSIGV